MHFLFIYFYYEQSYLSIYWTNFHDFFHQMEGICVDFLDQVLFFFDSLGDIAINTSGDTYS